jgi:hypothetical protein
MAAHNQLRTRIPIRQTPRRTLWLTRLMTTWASACLLVIGVASAETQTQHAFDTSVALKRFNVLWHLRARTKPEGGGLFQIRTGPIFEIDLNERVTLIAGSYFTREQEENTWTVVNRPFTGGEIMLWSHRVEVDWRSLLERFVVQQENDYFRFRNRFRISPPGRTAPYAGVEIFVDATGLRGVRYSAGLRRTFDEEFIVDFGYFFEDRRPAPSGERHMFSTSFHWRNKIRRIDPDF